ncbi:MAG TPA: ABC transporter permease [Atribacteraceae bacterium]|nr:ABC transporter permease [Atribacteraceae bacterium]
MMETSKAIISSGSWSARAVFLRWEWLLVGLIVGISIVNSRLSPHFWDYQRLIEAMAVFLERGFIVLPVAMILISGEIDISVSSTVALSSVLMAIAFQAGVPMGLAILVACVVGTLCGAFNGFLISRIPGLSSVIVTLAANTLFRGIAFIILGDRAVGGFPRWYAYLAWGHIGASGIPFIILIFAILAIIFGLVLHKTTFGRKIFAMGNNQVAARFSGIPVGRIKLILFTLAGAMSGLAAVFLTSKLGSSRPNIALGYELEVIAIAVLGGVSPSGGKGSIVGAILALILMRLLRFGLGLLNVPGQVMLVIIGTILVMVVMLPNLIGSVRFQRKRTG